MSEKRYIVQLTEEERASLTAIINAKRVARKKRMRAQVLRKIDTGEHGPAWTDARAADFEERHAPPRREHSELGAHAGHRVAGSVRDRHRFFAPLRAGMGSPELLDDDGTAGSRATVFRPATSGGAFDQG